MFLNLKAGLRQLGVPFRENDFAYARRHPEEPVGIIGKPHVLDMMEWKNPILFGAAVMSHPLADPNLLQRRPIHKILVPGEWMRKMCEPYWGDKVEVWPVGIDTDLWCPVPEVKKEYDFLIYDKVRWEHDRYEKELIEPIRRELRRQGLSFAEIRYGYYKEEDFHALLKKCKAVIFLCEHETQGIAYQQVLSMDIPILAWDRGGHWQDPQYYPEKIKFQPVSSVPYWNQKCGEVFLNAEYFKQCLKKYNENKSKKTYFPREFICKNLNLRDKANEYIKHYKSLQKQKICLIGISELANNPRIIKEAFALTEIGYVVTIITIKYNQAQEKSEKEKYQLNNLSIKYIDITQLKGFIRWLICGSRQIFSQKIYYYIKNKKLGEYAICRYLPELLEIAVKEKANMYIAHAIETVPIAAKAAKINESEAGVDFEDYFSKMEHYHDKQIGLNKAICDIEDQYTPKFQHITTASCSISSAIEKKYNKKAYTVRNFFPLNFRKDLQGPSNVSGKIKIYWFSQTIGLDRGLQCAFSAVSKLPSQKWQLYLRGAFSSKVDNEIKKLLNNNKIPFSNIILLDKIHAEDMVYDANKFDIGLALEQPVSENRRICMEDLSTNKCCTYLLAGLAVAATGIQGIRSILGGAGFSFAFNHPDQLTQILARWIDKKDELLKCKQKAWDLGRNEYNWDLEKNTLKRSFTEIF